MKICWLSDFGVAGSGYRNISIPLCLGLAERGHDVKAVGLKYRGEEHDFPFSILPAEEFIHALASIHNLANPNIWGIDVLVVALDIPLQVHILKQLKTRTYKYVAISPLEAPPLNFSNAAELMAANSIFIITRFGTAACQEAGLPAQYLEVGIDTDSWRLPTPEERSMVRSSYGMNDETFVVLTVADNQERKLLSRSLEIYRDFIKNTGLTNSRYILVTREHLDVGWNLRDLVAEYGLEQYVMILERGMPFMNLWGLYAAADCFLLTSKTEGYGMILLEAMAVGVPCLATDCTGGAELLADGRGTLIDVDYTLRDPFNNGWRYFASMQDGARKLEGIWRERPDTISGREFAESRDWQSAINLLDEEVRKYEPKQ
jgi:glycosyltransferase involved in cell wall biosynthesis